MIKLKRLKTCLNLSRVAEKNTHAHLHTMIKTPVKFQNDRYKTVGGSRLTKIQLSLQLRSIRAQNMAKLKMQKMCKKIIWNK